MLTLNSFCFSTAESYRKSFIAQSGGESLKAHKLFCSWDFGISNQRAADMKRFSIYHELKSILNELHDSEYHLTLWQKIGGYIISVVIWIFIVVVLIAIEYSIVHENILDVSMFGDNHFRVALLLYIENLIRDKHLNFFLSFSLFRTTRKDLRIIFSHHHCSYRP